MTKTICLLFAAAFFLNACNNSTSDTAAAAKDTTTTTTASVDPSTDWKFGIELYTFHTYDFPGAIEKIDSSGLKFIEPNTFQSAGKAFKDSSISNLSPASLEKLVGMISAKGIQAKSIYIGGDSTVASWKKQFDIAKAFGVEFVTAEPPMKLWDQVDSLAGVYNMKVAIHEHWKGVSLYWNPDTVLLAIKGHPNFGACADLGHWPKSGIDPLEGVKKLSGHIIAIHLKDIAAFNDPKLKDVPVGTGIVNFPAVFKELKAQGFKGYIYIERDAEDLPDNLPSVMTTIKYYNTEIGKLK